MVQWAYANEELTMFYNESYKRKCQNGRMRADRQNKINRGRVMDFINDDTDNEKYVRRYIAADLRKLRDPWLVKLIQDSKRYLIWRNKQNVKITQDQTKHLSDNLQREGISVGNETEIIETTCIFSMQDCDRETSEDINALPSIPDVNSRYQMACIRERNGYEIIDQGFEHEEYRAVAIDEIITDGSPEFFRSIEISDRAIARAREAQRESRERQRIYAQALQAIEDFEQSKSETAARKRQQNTRYLSGI